MTTPAETEFGDRNSAVCPRSDASVLHVDFEDVADGVFINIINAGVRWLGDPLSDVKQGEVRIVNNPSLAFAGARAAHVRTVEADQRGRIVLQRRCDSPDLTASGEAVVAEFMFRAGADAASAADLEEFVLWSTTSHAGSRSGIVLYASGRADSGTFDVEVEHADGADARNLVATGLRQTEWTHFVLNRRPDRATVELWLGTPGKEARAGEFPDINPKRSWDRVEFGDTSSSDAIGSGYWDDVRIGKPLAANSVTIAPAEKRLDVSNDAPKIRYPITVRAERQLFVDDVLIQSSQGIVRTLHPVQKHPANPLMIPDRHYEIEAKSILPVSVYREPETKQFRMWYGVWGKQVGKPTYQAYAVSDDGITWRKPSLGLYELNGSTDNNIVREGRMFRVMPHPSEPDPAKRYKAAIRDAGFIAAYSPDGLRWTTTRPILDQSLDATSVHWDAVSQKWIASCKIFFNGVRARGYAESKDFENWSDTHFMLIADERDRPKDQIYSMHIVRYQSVYVGIAKIYHLDTDRCDVQLAFSRNARQWQRPDRTPFIPNSPEPGAWDYGNIDDCANNPIVMEDHLRFYYSGRSTLHNQMPNDGAMGMGTLRIDGFISMDASGPEGGVLVTRPVRLAGQSLFINADAAGGEVRVELLDEKKSDTTADEADVPIYPFLKASCAPIKTDSVRHRVTWNGSSSLESLEDRPVRIRFHLRRAELYSFWTE